MVEQFPPKADSPLEPKAHQPQAEARTVTNKMFVVYVLRSLKNNKRYTGYTSKSVEVRLSEHLSGTNQWTRHNKPFKLIYQESFTGQKEAMKREKFFKSGQGRKWLDQNMNN